MDVYIYSKKGTSFQSSCFLFCFLCIRYIITPVIYEPILKTHYLIWNGRLSIFPI